MSWKFQLALVICLSHNVDVRTTKDRQECVFPNCPKEEFCNGYYNVVLDPKDIPTLTSFLQHCFALFIHERNEEGDFRRQMLIKLLDSASPVVHKAYFDKLTSLKAVVDFIGVKLRLVDFNVYAETLGIYEDPNNRWKQVGERHTFYYAPCSATGSYSPEDEKSRCEQLKSHSNQSKDCAINRTQLIRVHRVARAMEFPVVNLTTPSSSEDTSFLILDMYILASRCLTVVPELPCAECALEGILEWIRKSILPHINLRELEKVYLASESLTIRT